MASKTLTYCPSFPYTIDREYGFQDVYASLKQLISVYRDVTDDNNLFPVYTRFAPDEAMDEIIYPCFVIDHLSYNIDFERRQSRERYLWRDFLNNNVKIRPESLPVTINCQITPIDEFHQPLVHASQWLMETLSEAFKLEVFGNDLVGLIQEPISIGVDIKDTRRKIQDVLPCVIHARVFPQIIENAPLILQKVYRVTVI